MTSCTQSPHDPDAALARLENGASVVSPHELPTEGSGLVGEMQGDA